jgi:hypothetical protein
MLFSMYLASLITFSSVVHTQQNLPLPQNVKIAVHRIIDKREMGGLQQDSSGGFRIVEKLDDGTVFTLIAAKSDNPTTNKSFHVGTRAPPPL